MIHHLLSAVEGCTVAEKSSPPVEEEAKSTLPMDYTKIPRENRPG